MADYRCAECGSDKVTAEIESAMAEKPSKRGRKQNNSGTFHCEMCGATLNHSMPAYEKVYIDALIASPISNGQKLAEYKEKYINLEITQPQQTEPQSSILSADEQNELQALSNAVVESVPTQQNVNDVDLAALADAVAENPTPQ